MRKVRTTVAVIVLGAAIVGVLLYVTLRSAPSGKDGGGVFQGVTAGWCNGRGGVFVPNVPAGGGPDLGSCTVGNTPQGS
jgi:hypothetical protein